jgi:uncharacterized membrane protein YadS
MFGVFLSLLGAIVSPYLATQAPSLANATSGPPAFFLLFIVGSIFLASNSLVSSRVGALSPNLLIVALAGLGYQTWSHPSPGPEG